MHTFHYGIEVGAPQGTRVERLAVLVDTGSTFMVVPAGMLHRLGVAPMRNIRLRLVDGDVIEREIGEAQVRVEGEAWRRLLSAFRLYDVFMG